MVELSNERVEQILHTQTQKTEELKTILRALYTRYMNLFERYFADIDALNDDTVAEMKKDHEETISLIKYYYLDIPLDICVGLSAFDNEYLSKMLGSDWHKYLIDSYQRFTAGIYGGDKSEKSLKAEFRKQSLTAFYAAMDSVFREAFSTSSKTAENMVSGIAGMLFGKKE